MKTSIPDLKFNMAFKGPMLMGIKTKTSRFMRYGDVGDRFHVFRAVFEITAVERMKLGDVAAKHFIAEGFENQQDFWDFWEEIHPKRRGPDELVWMHTFRLVKGDGR